MWLTLILMFLRLGSKGLCSLICNVYLSNRKVSEHAYLFNNEATVNVFSATEIENMFSVRSFSVQGMQPNPFPRMGDGEEDKPTLKVYAHRGSAC